MLQRSDGIMKKNQINTTLARDSSQRVSRKGLIKTLEQETRNEETYVGLQSNATPKHQIDRR
jgi:hypothetical protein